MESTNVEPFMNQLSRLRLLSLAVVVGLAGCGGTTSEADTGESGPADDPVVQAETDASDVLDMEDVDPFGRLRVFMIENAPSSSLFDSIDLVPALDNGRRILVSVF